MSDIHFFEEETAYQIENSESVVHWIESVIQKEGKSTGEISIIFCSDDYLLAMNKKYLDHHYYTDIITFDNSSDDEHIEGDIFISVDRVRENASSLNQDFTKELMRVIIHGILHLIGFNDKSEEEKAAMTEKEDACLSLLTN